MMSLLLAVGLLAAAPGAPLWRGPNYDKSKIAPYTLEDPLVFKDGRRVLSVEDWRARRAEILDIFAKEMYGAEPPPPEALETEKFDERVSAAGFAVRRQYRMWFRKDRTGPCVSWIVWTPRHAKGPVPVVLLLNYRGNHELTTEPGVPVQTGWVRNNERHFIDNHRASGKTRGKLAATDAIDTFPLGTILARGYAVASACYCEVSPDPYWTEPAPYEQARFAYTGVFDLWGPRDPARTDNPTAIGAWAWALSRGLDLVRTLPEIDRAKTVVTGCSRLGKAALLAAARDERFAVCVVNQAGGGGVCLAKRDYGENPSTENVQFSHWYCAAYRKYSDDFPRTLTFDQHLLAASIAPRALLVEGFDSSKWMDTEGEFLACRAAAPVWRFLGLGTMPDVPYPDNYDLSAVGECLGYVRRSEDHGIAHCDWLWLLDFADKAWKRAAAEKARPANGAREWENTKVNERRREPPRAFSLPLASEAAALSDAPVPETPYRLSLNGRWKLSWTGNPALRVRGFERPDHPDGDWFDVAVPGCVELQGFGTPGYVNSRYPHKQAWPRILDRQTGRPDYNPVSSYRRRFTVPAAWKGREIFLRFDGVYSAFYVWVNGKPAGYAEDSCLPSEFNVTPLLTDGENVLAVEVYRWCDGSYLEDQDMTRYSGIYRDVSLWSMPKGGLWDFAVETSLTNGRRDARIAVSGADGATWTLYDPEKRAVAEGTSGAPAALVGGVRLWSAEKPVLYTLVIRRNGDIRARKVGFREVTLAGNAVLVNGRKIKFRGVNRHETSPTGGRTVTPEEMIRDITLFKRYNIDTVRTSHYPDHPLWYDLCDRYGIYVCAEANVEGHGAGFAEEGLGRFPAWRDSIVSRNERHVRFYRNHPSVVFWSVGNETGHGPCFTEAIARVKALDPTRPVLWERGNPDADIDSHMYRSVEWLANRGALGDKPRGSATEKGWPDENCMSAGKPFFLCEYAHAMGNAVGNFAEYWDVFWKYDALAGGCVWDWADQAVWQTTGRVGRDGKPERYLAYGGDWDELPNDGSFNCNGLVGAERAVTAKLLEVAHVQRNLVVRDDLTLENRHGFTRADEYDGAWALIEDGVETRWGTFAVPRVEPLSTGKLRLPPLMPAAGAEAFVNISFLLKNDTPWAKKGWCVSRNQIRLTPPRPSAAAAAPTAFRPQIRETDETVTVAAGGTTAVFSRRTGTLGELTIGGRRILRDPAPGLAAGPRLTCARAFVDNDIWVRGYTPDEPRCFPRSGLTQLRYHARPVVVADGRVRLSVEVTGAKSAGFRHESEWSFLPDGQVVVSNTVLPYGTMPRRLPRLGLSLRLDNALARVRWYGRGPRENYTDRKTASFFGRYESTVPALYEPYARPQDNGYRSDVRWVEFLADDGTGVRFSASEPLFVQALPYSAEDLERARHRKGEPRALTPLTPADEIYVNLDIRQLGLGNASCGPTTLPQYTFPVRPERWVLRIGRPAR